MLIVNKCITTHTEGMIAHGVNCCGVMGAGVAKIIAEKYPIVRQEYFKKFDKKVQPELLGTIQEVEINKKLSCFNLFCQVYYGDVITPYNNQPQNLDYGALDKVLNQLFYTISKRDKVLYMPKIGCGLAKGNWNIVREFIIHYENKYGINCIICDP